MSNENDDECEEEEKDKKDEKPSKDDHRCPSSSSSVVEEIIEILFDSFLYPFRLLWDVIEALFEFIGSFFD